MRKLASIQRISKISKIENADTICCVSILGWQVVCRIDEVKENELVIYCEIDSLMPKHPAFEFLKKMTNETMRIRTVRLRGQISQGICFPLSFIKNFGFITIENFVEGQDVTKILGITKYQDVIPDELLGKAKGYMPSEIPKSDIIRVQTMQDVLDKYKGTLCYETEKLDGESITFYLKDGIFGVCSKEVDFIESDDCLHWIWKVNYVNLLNTIKKMKINGNFMNFLCKVK